MTTSPTIKNISTALITFHREMPTILKDSLNPFFKSHYASLPSILKAIKEPLLKNGLTIVQFPEAESGLTTRLIHDSGEWMESTYIMKPVKATPQDAGSAITYQRRYAIGAILNLDIDDDDDANAGSGKTTKAETTAPADDKPWLNDGSEPFNKAIEFLAKGGDLKKIEAKYRISKKVRELLLTAAV